MSQLNKYKRLIAMTLLMFITITSIPINSLVHGESAYEQELNKYMEILAGNTGKVSYSINALPGDGIIQLHVYGSSGAVVRTENYYEGSPKSGAKDVKELINMCRSKIYSLGLPNNLNIGSLKEDMQVKQEDLQQELMDKKLSDIASSSKITVEIGFDDSGDGLAGSDGTVSVYYMGELVSSKKLQLANLTTVEQLEAATTTAWTALTADVIAKLPGKMKNATKEEIINELIALNIMVKNNYSIDSKVEYGILPDGRIQVFITINGNKDSLILTPNASGSIADINHEVSKKILELAAKLNEKIQELTGDFTGNVFKTKVTKEIQPTGFDSNGGVKGWIDDGVTKMDLVRITIPNVKDMNGDPIVMVAYEGPFGPTKNGQQRFLGYCPRGYPLTNPFYPDDITSVTPLWNRGHFNRPWANPELKGRFKTDPNARRYMVSLKEIEKVDGNKELNKLTWMGLKFHWSTHVSASDEFEPWHEVVKIQVPPTDDTWGMAYYPSKVNGGFRYVTIPIPPQSMLGIDIKTDTVISTPQIVTGNKVEIKTVYSIHNVKSAKDKEKFLNMDFNATVKSPLFGEKKYS